MRNSKWISTQAPPWHLEFCVEKNLEARHPDWLVMSVAAAGWGEAVGVGCMFHPFCVTCKLLFQAVNTYTASHTEYRTTQVPCYTWSPMCVNLGLKQTAIQIWPSSFGAVPYGWSLTCGLRGLSFCAIEASFDIWPGGVRDAGLTLFP